MKFNNGYSKRRYLYKCIIAGITVVLTILSIGCSNISPDANQTVPRLASPQQNPSQVDRVDIGDSADIITAAGRVTPSVVGIVTTKISGNQRVQSVGSGIIVDSNGYILTNNHVAGRDAESVVVSLYDGREVRGNPVWVDPVLDLSIVKIKADRLTVAVLGDSKAIKVGQQAIAIGNPLGLTFQRTVTAGIISAVNRTIEVGRGVFMEDLIQTDASINPGNSGGPLINIKGEVVGINTIKVTSAEAMGFAVPINVIKPVFNKLANEGAFVSPAVGLQALDKELGRVYGFTAQKGVYVFDCKDGGCAYRAGIRKGDAILSVEGKEVNTSLELKEELYRAGTGKPVTMRVRGGDGIEKDVYATFDGEK